MFKIICILVLIYLSLEREAHAVTSTNVPEDMVVFFKQAISSPLDIEHFGASQRNLRKPTLPEAAKPDKSPLDSAPLIFEGKRSGANYYFRMVRTNPGKNIKMEFIQGRAGSNSFQINANTLTQTYEEYSSHTNNYVAAGSDMGFKMVGRFLNMGLVDIKPESLVWEKNEFTAVNDRDLPVYGRLEISNNLPSRLEISDNRNGPPYKAFSYTYPTPPVLFSGFPQKTVILSREGNHEGALTPAQVLTLSNIQLAKTPPPVKDFVPTRFVTRAITYTNVYRDGACFALRPDGTLQKIPSTASE